METNKSDVFAEELFHIADADISKLQTIVVWWFQSKTNPDEKRYFIKNNLFSSNWREKIRNMLGTFDFVEEENTGIALQKGLDGKLEYNSLLAIHSKTQELRGKYSALTGDISS